MRLFDIAPEIDRLTTLAWNAAEENDGIIPDDLSEQLDALIDEKDRKIENIACLIKNLRADAEAYKAQKMDFADRQKKAENKVEWLSQYLQACLEPDVTDKKKKWEYDRACVSFRATKKAVIDDIESLDRSFIRVKEEADKVQILNALKAGEEVEGAHMEEALSMSIK